MVLEGATLHGRLEIQPAFPKFFEGYVLTLSPATIIQRETILTISRYLDDVKAHKNMADSVEKDGAEIDTGAVAEQRGFLEIEATI